jgi:hypothetical protein
MLDTVAHTATCIQRTLKGRLVGIQIYRSLYSLRQNLVHPEQYMRMHLISLQGPIRAPNSCMNVVGVSVPRLPRPKASLDEIPIYLSSSREPGRFYEIPTVFLGDGKLRATVPKICIKGYRGIEEKIQVIGIWHDLDNGRVERADQQRERAQRDVEYGPPCKRPRIIWSCATTGKTLQHYFDSGPLHKASDFVTPNRTESWTLL